MNAIDETELFTQMQAWGYYLPTKSHPHSPGYPGLYVAVRRLPTESHYDPESVELCLLTAREVVERVHLTRHSHIPHVQRVCPGRVSLHDRFNKRADFYTYGAQLQGVGSQDEVIYVFTSSAPILALSEGWRDFPDQLESESEALLAHIHALWRRNDAGFARRLVDLDPLDLYLAILRAVDAVYHSNSILRDHFHDFFIMLQREIHWHQETGRWQENGCPLEALLAPPAEVA